MMATANGALWFGLFAAPAAWALQLISNYALLAHFCYPRNTPLSSPDFGGTRAVAIVVSAALLVVAVLALLTAIRSWRMTKQPANSAAAAGDEARGVGRVRFMAQAGVLVSGIFVYGVVMAAVPLLAMRPCTL
jgi:hypothetical protein